MQIKITIDIEVPQILRDLTGLLLQKDSEPSATTVVTPPVMEATKVEEPKAKEPVKAEEPVRAEEPRGAAPLTLADAKEAMNAARIRIEGENYQDSTSEGHKLYHKELTGMMKSLMTRANPDALRPADLTPPQLAGFIQSINQLDLVDGRIIEQVPF